MCGIRDYKISLTGIFLCYFIQTIPIHIHDGSIDKPQECVTDISSKTQLSLEVVEIVSRQVKCENGSIH